MPRWYANGKKDPTNARDRRRFFRARHALRARWRRRYRVNAYRDAAKTMLQSPVSIAELTRAGQGHRAARDRQDHRGENQGAPRDRARSRLPRSSSRSFRPTPGPGDADPGLGAKTARRLFDELGVASIDDLRAGDRRAAHPRDEGPRPEGRGEHRRAARKLGEEGPAERVLLSDALPSPRARADLRDHPASEPSPSPAPSGALPRRART